MYYIITKNGVPVNVFSEFWEALDYTIREWFKIESFYLNSDDISITIFDSKSPHSTTLTKQELVTDLSLLIGSKLYPDKDFIIDTPNNISIHPLEKEN